MTVEKRRKPSHEHPRSRKPSLECRRSALGKHRIAAVAILNARARTHLPALRGKTLRRPTRRAQEAGRERKENRQVRLPRTRRPIPPSEVTFLISPCIARRGKHRQGGERSDGRSRNRERRAQGRATAQLQHPPEC